MGMITDRETDAANLAKIAADRKQAAKQCKHADIARVGESTVFICRECRRPMPSGDAFRRPNVDWLRSKQG